MLKSLILLIVHLISLCCPVLFQARPIDSLNRTSLNCYRHCGCPACVCVCVSVRSFLPPRASRPRNICTYVFTATRKTLYIAIIIVIFAENASFGGYGRRHLLEITIRDFN